MHPAHALDLLKTGRDAVPAALAKKARTAQPGHLSAVSPLKELNRRLHTPRMKALAKAFAVH